MTDSTLDLSHCPVTEPVPAPEILVDGYLSTATANGVVKFTFFSMAHDPATNVTQRRVVLRLSASIPVVAGMEQAFTVLMAELTKSAQEARQHAQ